MTKIEQIITERIKELHYDYEREIFPKRKAFIKSLIMLNLEIKKRLEYQNQDGCYIQ